MKNSLWQNLKLNVLHLSYCKEAQRKYFETHEGTFKGKHHSEETKKGKPSWNKGKKLGHNGTHWYNNGEINVKAKECPEGFVKGRLYIWQK